MLGDVHTQPVSIIAVALIGKPVAIVDKGVVFVIVLFDVWVDLDLIRILVYVYKVQDLRFGWNLSFLDALDNPVYDWNTLITDYLSALE